jgi:hypothetical protein
VIKMSSFQRSNLYASEELGGNADDMDMSGFLGSPPPTQEEQERAREPRAPPIPTVRPRQRPSPSSDVSSTQPNIGWTIPAMPNPDTPKWYHPVLPWWAHEESIGSPMAPVVSKALGLSTFILLGMYKIGMYRNGSASPYASAGMWMSGALVVHPVIGVNHGVAKIVPGKDHIIAKYPRYGGIGIAHLGLGAFFGSKIKDSLKEAV